MQVHIYSVVSKVTMHTEYHLFAQIPYEFLWLVYDMCILVVVPSGIESSSLSFDSILLSMMGPSQILIGNELSF